MMEEPGVILITGNMAAGKSSVAQALAERLPQSVHLLEVGSQVKLVLRLSLPHRIFSFHAYRERATIPGAERLVMSQSGATGWRGYSPAPAGRSPQPASHG
jgi:hypothetical protein